MKEGILILQMRPEDEAANSEFEAILRVGNLKPDSVKRYRLEQGMPNISLKDYSAIIAGGSPFDVSEVTYKKSKVQKDIEAFYHSLFYQVIPNDFPFLGICSGNGLLGSYCNIPISKKYSEPISSVAVNLTKEGENDELLKGLPKNFQALVGHKEACDELPPNAVLLASSKSCPIQMFRIKNNIYATQFHPEADANEFVLRIKTYKNHGYFAPEEANSLISTIQNCDTPIPKKILRRFVKKYG